MKASFHGICPLIPTHFSILVEFPSISTCPETSPGVAHKFCHDHKLCLHHQPQFSSSLIVYTKFFISWTGRFPPLFKMVAKHTHCSNGVHNGCIFIYSIEFILCCCLKSNLALIISLTNISLWLKVFFPFLSMLSCICELWVMSFSSLLKVL